MSWLAGMWTCHAIAQVMLAELLGALLWLTQA